MFDDPGTLEGGVVDGDILEQSQDANWDGADLLVKKNMAEAAETQRGDKIAQRSGKIAAMMSGVVGLTEDVMGWEGEDEPRASQHTTSFKDQDR